MNIVMNTMGAIRYISSTNLKFINIFMLVNQFIKY